MAVSAWQLVHGGARQLLQGRRKGGVLLYLYFIGPAAWAEILFFNTKIYRYKQKRSLLGMLWHPQTVVKVMDF